MVNTSTDWIEYRRIKRNARVRLFCLPFAGGGASMYRTWVSAASDEIDVCPIQLPGRELRCGETPISRIDPLVSTLASVLQLCLDLPCFLFGYSMGALIAFELTRTLQARGQCPAHLFVSARRAPFLPDPQAPVHDLPNEEFIRRLQTFEGTPQELLSAPDVIEFFLPILRADFAVCETYQYRAGNLLNCPITVFGSTDDPTIAFDDLTGWRRETRLSCRIERFNGGHFFIRECSKEIMRICFAECMSYIDSENRSLGAVFDRAQTGTETDRV